MMRMAPWTPLGHQTLVSQRLTPTRNTSTTRFDTSTATSALSGAEPWKAMWPNSCARPWLASRSFFSFSPSSAQRYELCRPSSMPSSCPMALCSVVAGLGDWEAGACWSFRLATSHALLRVTVSVVECKRPAGTGAETLLAAAAITPAGEVAASLTTAGNAPLTAVLQGTVPTDSAGEDSAEEEEKTEKTWPEQAPTFPCRVSSKVISSGHCTMAVVESVWRPWLYSFVHSKLASETMTRPGSVWRPQAVTFPACCGHATP
mmetsp:Transcript_24876/g.57757  ORF Transcript_24876/g.57757 Transcript_24876/m.57757 type:complete len:261 (-) Transcript_24876:340-1122(-)